MTESASERKPSPQQETTHPNRLPRMSYRDAEMRRPRSKLEDLLIKRLGHLRGQHRKLQDAYLSRSKDVTYYYSQIAHQRKEHQREMHELRKQLDEAKYLEKMADVKNTTPPPSTWKLALETVAGIAFLVGTIVIGNLLTIGLIAAYLKNFPLHF